jgi:Mn-dependent DtxR family transcriptional regulator
MIRDSNLSSTDRHLLRVVAEYGEADEDWPTTKQIAEAMNVGVVTVLAHTTVLGDQGWLEREGWPPKYKPAIPDKILPLMMDAS